MILQLSQVTSAGEIPADSPVADALRKAEERIAAVIAIPAAQRNFDNTLGALDELYTHLSNDTELIQFMKEVSTNPAERAKGERAAKDVADWATDLATREDLYIAVRTYADTKPRLEGEQKRLLEHVLRDYRRAGMELPKEKRDELNAIQKQITELALHFQGNIRDDESVVLLTRDELKGMDDGFLATLPRVGDLYVCNLENPTYMPMIEFCESEIGREKMWVARHRKGGQKNARALESILKLRSRAATLLGYSNDVDYQTEIRMAKNAASVKKFYDELRPIVRKKAAVEFAEYTAAKREHTGNANAELRPWDQSFYENWLKNKRYAVDGKKVQEYFPMERCVEGLFSVTQKLYGIEYREITRDAASRSLPIWHEDVRIFDVFDTTTKELLGTFYTDLFPRPNKYSHAAQFGLRPRKRFADGKVQTPLVALVCNFTKPTADKPSLLTHDEVETFFHEFGHCLHSILTKAEYAQFSGTAVARDFVEAPSQMFENWVWDARVLETFARHYKTNEPLPAALLDGMMKARTFGKGLWSERQIFFGMMDLTYHLDDDGELDSTAIGRKVFGDVLQYGEFPELYVQSAFGHLMHYNSGYYGYMWSLVYAADMFQRFQQLGMLDPKAGMYYRERILAKGGTQDEMEMVKDYLGREPQKEPFLKYLGLSAN